MIYNTLVADAAFMLYVGTYTFATNGQRLPAISIVSPGESMPRVKKVVGLECVIHDAGDVTRADYLDSTNANINWRVFLIAWEPAKGIDMTQAALRLIQIFGGARTNETVAVSDGLGALAQTMATIPSNSPILL